MESFYSDRIPRPPNHSSIVSANCVTVRINDDNDDEQWKHCPLICYYYYCQYINENIRFDQLSIESTANISPIVIFFTMQ